MGIRPIGWPSQPGCPSEKCELILRHENLSGRRFRFNSQLPLNALSPGICGGTSTSKAVGTVEALKKNKKSPLAIT